MEGNVSLSVSLSVSRSTIKILWLFQWHPHEDFRGNASTNEWNVAQISVSPSGSLPFVFCAMMWYEIWACIVLIIENTLILILSHCAFQKGSYKGEQSSLGILRSKPTPPALHATVRHTPDCTLRRTLRFGSDSRWMQRSITSLVMLRWEGSSAFTSGPSRSSTSSHSAGGGTSGDSDGEMDDIWLTDLANMYPHWQVLSDRTATTIWNHTIIKNHFLFCPHTPIWIT